MTRRNRGVAISTLFVKPKKKEISSFFFGLASVSYYLLEIVNDSSGDIPIRISLLLYNAINK